ncbi:hypothetical protein PVK06_024175 [Gossypium arboreum]|uniref:Uncharacterized protein n=1 Tax=Gossypium arboreum TaxID=29729 RepID=A0ABR0PDB5_GOSAR|nr:hypothetical protein PVK06_024175 [Gossypium arboreum]
MRNVKERIDDVNDRLIDGLQMMNEQLREYLWGTIGSLENKFTGKDDALEAIMKTLKEEINELKGELKIFKAAISNGMLTLKLKQQAIYVPKSKVFKGARSASKVDNFLLAVEQYFRVINIEDDATKELIDAMMVTESLVELVPRRNRFESSKPNRRGNGWYCEKMKRDIAIMAAVVAAVVVIGNQKMGSGDLVA